MDVWTGPATAQTPCSGEDSGRGGRESGDNGEAASGGATGDGEEADEGATRDGEGAAGDCGSTGHDTS